MSALDTTILSYKEIFLKEAFDMVILPGDQGDIGVIPGERSLVYVLKPGIIHCFKDNKVVKRFYIINGFFKSKDNSLLVTTNNMVFDLDNLDISDIKAQLEEFSKKIEESEDTTVKDYYSNLTNIYNEVLDSEKSSLY